MDGKRPPREPGWNRRGGDLDQRRQPHLLISNAWKSREGEMRALDAVRGIFIKLADRAATQRRLSRFKCGDCARWEQCGQAPSDYCIVRLAEIERDGDRPRPGSPRGYLSRRAGIHHGIVG
jgi:hypothetical protein